MLLREKTFLVSSVSELTENPILQDQHIAKLKEAQKKFFEEASLREEELNMYIKEQETVLETANEDINKLRKHIADFPNKHTITQFTQTPINKTVIKQTQTENIPIEDNLYTETTATSFCVQPDDSSKKPEKYENRIGKILLVAGNQGKELVHFLRRHIETYSISSIVKSNASNSELLKTTLSNSKHFTKIDIIIFWSNINSGWLLNHLNAELKHTYFIILTASNGTHSHKIKRKNIPK